VQDRAAIAYRWLSIPNVCCRRDTGEDPAAVTTSSTIGNLNTCVRRNSGGQTRFDFQQLDPLCASEETIMPLIQLLEVLIVVGVLLWLVNRFIPMQGSIKSILNGVVVIAVVLWLLNVFGLFHSISRIHVGT
jgi:hypothetical protein